MTSIPTEITAPSRQRKPLHPALQANIWRPGQSGNPGGKGEPYRKLTALAREQSPEGMKQIIEIACDYQNDPRVRLVAWDIVLTRAWGKPREAAPDDAAKAPLNLSNLNAKELQTLKRLSAKMRGDAEPEPAVEPEPDGGIVVEE